MTAMEIENAKRAGARRELLGHAKTRLSAAGARLTVLAGTELDGPTLANVVTEVNALLAEAGQIVNERDGIRLLVPEPVVKPKG